MSRSLQQHQAYNLETRDDWDCFESHRQQVARLAVRASKSFEAVSQTEANGPTLAILGAGNGNDLDLQTLAQHFRRITLFDRDAQAMEQIHVRYQHDQETWKRLEFAAPVDLTSVAHLLDRFPNQATAATEEEARRLADLAVENRGFPQGDRFDVVLSACLLTQLIETVVLAVSKDAPYLANLILAVRDGQLNLINPDDPAEWARDFGNRFCLKHHPALAWPGG